MRRQMVTTMYKNMLIISSKGQIGRPIVFHLQNHGHITTENDFPVVHVNDILVHV